MERDDRKPDPNDMRHPDQRHSDLASTHEDASLVDQILDDSPHPDARRDFAERRQRRDDAEELGHS